MGEEQDSGKGDDSPAEVGEGGDAAQASPEEAAESTQAAGQASLTGTSYEAEDVFENAEPWDPIETKLVLGSFIAAAFFLGIFGYLVNVYLLH
ncbi:hypothetical protein ACFL59_07860 [Planctomycetota bacterium]